MNYGMTLSAAGVLTSMHRLDVAANNLANASTIGFRSEFAMQRPLWLKGGEFQGRAPASEEVVAY